MVTELVPGETLVSLEESAGYLRVNVPGHPSSLDERGYPGWASPNSPLVPAGEWSPELSVARPNRRGLPLGTLLRATRGRAALPGGDPAGLDPGDTIAIGSATSDSATGIGLSLLGLPYRWGGTDSTTGMDCSGLVYRVMQLLGVTVPRDSDDQFERAPFKSEGRWDEALPGDLVFFGEQGITHVGFYLGAGEYVSAHGADDTGCVIVRSMTEDPYQGFARY
jgi:cell wall-associated NlpC family hydrolase